MDTPEEVIRTHYRELAAEMARHVATLMDAPSEDSIAALIQFLTQELLPHARGEERALYPAIDPPLKAHGKATATMSIDHEAMERYIRRIEDAARVLTGGGRARARNAELVRLLLQLQAIFELHFCKERSGFLRRSGFTCHSSSSICRRLSRSASWQRCMHRKRETAKRARRRRPCWMCVSSRRASVTR